MCVRDLNPRLNTEPFLTKKNTRLSTFKVHRQRVLYNGTGFSSVELDSDDTVQV